MVRRAQGRDRDEVAKMRALLWPDGTPEEHAREFDKTFENGFERPMSGTMPMAVLVAEDGSGRVIAFLEVGLRSHADGCDPALPVGYVEGWFVQEEFRKQGIGRV